MRRVPLLDLKQQYREIRDEVRRAVEDVFESQEFVLGPWVDELERKIAEYCGTDFAVGVASGSDALLLSLMALDIGKGDEVITTPYTFFSTAGYVTRVGAKPVFVDIDPVTFNIDPALIEEKITARTKAIIPVHLFGQCADMDPIMVLADKHHLAVIEDAAQAIGARNKGKRAGSIGDAGTLSFYPSKNLGGCGDGGMVLTSKKDVAERVRLLRNLGRAERYYHVTVGCNSRLDSLQAAVLLVKLKSLDKWINARRRNATTYDDLFSKLPVRTPRTSEGNFHVYNQYVIRVKERDGLAAHLGKNGIGSAIYYPLPLHLQKCYEDLGLREGDFPQAETAATEALALPVYPGLQPEDLQYVVDVISGFQPTEPGL